MCPDIKLRVLSKKLERGAEVASLRAAGRVGERQVKEGGEQVSSSSSSSSSITRHYEYLLEGLYGNAL